MALSKEAKKYILIGCIAFVVIAAIVTVIVIFVPRSKKNADQKQTHEMETFKNENKGKITQHENKPRKLEKHVSFEDQFLQSYIENSI